MTRRRSPQAGLVYEGIGRRRESAAMTEAIDKTVLVTGAAGFIGSAVAVRLAAMGYRVVGCDNFNDYYDPR
jgi:UDP-glucuronate 4-epimerase